MFNRQSPRRASNRNRANRDRARFGGVCRTLALSSIASFLALSSIPGQAQDQVAGSSGNAEVVEAGARKEAVEAADLEEAVALKKVGEARLRVMLWSIYDSRLYTADGQYREGTRPLRLEIQYLRDIRSDALVSRTEEEWEAMGRRHPRRNAWLSRLDALWPDITESDVLTLEIDANDVSTFLHNGERLGRIDDPDFGQQFIDIWLSEDCTRPALREALLGVTDAN